MTAGYFDTSFGTKGRAVAAFGGFTGQPPKVEAIAVQSDGKIVEAGIARSSSALTLKGSTNTGEIGIVRFTVRGKLDTSFGVGGKANVSFATKFPSSSDVVGVAADSLGRIYVAGTGIRANGTPEIIVVRLTPNGKLDTSFGIGGRSFANFDPLGSTGAKAAGLALDSGGRAVVAGTVLGTNGQNEFGVIRLGLDGNFDPSFGNGGRSIDLVALPDLNQDQVVGVAIDNQQRIIVGGMVSNLDQMTSLSQPDPATAPAVLRVLSNGNADPAFGNTANGFNRGVVPGVYVGPASPSIRVTGVAVDSLDRVVLAGDNNGPSQNSPEFMATRISAVGRLDDAFGVGGYSFAGFTFNGQQQNQGNAVAVDDTNNIVIVGGVIGGGRQASAVIRLSATGSFDPGFGVGGKSNAGFGLGTDVANAVTFDAAGRILLGSTVFAKRGSEFGVARLQA